MNRAWLLLLIAFLVGCFNRSDRSDNDSHNAQVSSATTDVSPKWQRVGYKIGEKDYVRFALNATSKISPHEGDSSKVRILLGCGYLPALVVDVPSAENGDVKTAFDEAALMPQKWIWFPEDHFLGPAGGHAGEKKLLAQMMRSKTFKLEFTPQRGSPQLVTFDMLDIRDLINQEPVCKSWR